MPTSAEYEARIKGLDWEGLKALWVGIQARDTPGWAPGRALEYLILRAFEIDGAEVRWPYSVEVEGEEAEQIDGAIHVGGLSCLVEIKDTADQINIVPVAKMRNQLMRRPSGTVGLVFSRAGFTQPAIILTRYISSQTILLWYGSEIGHALGRGKICDLLVRKYRACTEEGIPDRMTDLGTPAEK